MFNITMYSTGNCFFGSHKLSQGIYSLNDIMERAFYLWTGDLFNTSPFCVSGCRQLRICQVFRSAGNALSIQFQEFLEKLKNETELS
jgi:hypothetical protein